MGWTLLSTYIRELDKHVSLIRLSGWFIITCYFSFMSNIIDMYMSDVLYGTLAGWICYVDTLPLAR